MEHFPTILAAALSRFTLVYIGIFLISIGLLCFKRTTSFEFGRLFTLFLVTGIVPSALSPLAFLAGARPGAAALTLALPSLLLIYYVVRHFGRWIVFNINPAEFEGLVEDCLDELGVGWEREGPTYRMPDKGASVTLSFQPVLRYAIVHLERGTHPETLEALERLLREKLVNLKTTPIYLEGSLFLTIGLLCFLSALF